MSDFQIIDQILGYAFFGLGMSAMAGVVLICIRLALVGAGFTGLFWVLDKLPF